MPFNISQESGIEPRQLPKEKLPVGWPWRLLFLSIVILGLAVFIWVGLSFGYKPFLHSRINTLDKETENLRKSLSPEEQENFLIFYSQIANLSKLLKNHIISSKIFPWMEQITNKKVYYNRFELSLLDHSLILQGQAQSLEILSQQLESFKETPEIERFVLKNTKLVGRETQFDLKIFLKNNFLNFK